MHNGLLRRPLSRPQLFHDIQATAVWVLMALRRQNNKVAHLWFLTHTWVRQGDNLGPGLFRRSYDAEVAEWHAELDQHQWAERSTWTCESDTLPAHAVPLATGGLADDLARTSIARSHKELNDINQLTTALGRRAPGYATEASR